MNFIGMKSIEIRTDFMGFQTFREISRLVVMKTHEMYLKSHEYFERCGTS